MSTEDKVKRIVRLEISHCRECPFSRKGRPIPFAEFTTATICGQTNKECYWDYSDDDNKAEFFPSHCPLQNKGVTDADVGGVP
jgi:hypothetical protein